MINPAAALKVAKDELLKNPELIKKWNAQADTDPESVRQEIIAMAAAHGVKLSAGQLKFAVKAAKPFLGKLSPENRKHCEELFKKIC